MTDDTGVNLSPDAPHFPNLQWSPPVTAGATPVCDLAEVELGLACTRHHRQVPLPG